MIDLTMVLQAVLMLAATLVTAFLVPWIKGRIGEDNYRKLLQAVQIGVAAAEQLGKVYGWDGSRKKQYVILWLTEKGFSVDMDEIENLIEAMVHQMNDTGVIIA